MIPGRVVLELWRRDKGVSDLVVCDVCHGLGWHCDRSKPRRDPQAWPVHCKLCAGTGKLSLHAVAKLIDEHPTVLYRLYKQRVRQRTASRLFPKLIALSQRHGALDGAGGPGCAGILNIDYSNGAPDILGPGYHRD